MSQMPVENQTLEGYEPPRVVQFNVFLANRVGKLRELADLFGPGKVCLAGMSILDTADYAVVRLVCNRAGVLRRILHEQRLPFGEEPVLVVELGPEHTLAALCQALVGAELNIHYVYALMVQPHGCPAVVLHTDDPSLAGRVLRKKQFTLLGEADLSAATRSEPEG